MSQCPCVCVDTGVLPGGRANGRCFLLASRADPTSIRSVFLTLSTKLDASDHSTRCGPGHGGGWFFVRRCPPGTRVGALRTAPGTSSRVHASSTLWWWPFPPRVIARVKLCRGNMPRFPDIHVFGPLVSMMCVSYPFCVGVINGL